jgi:hypothetical protein
LDQARHHAREGRRHREFAGQRIAEGQFDLAASEGLVADWAEDLSDKYRKAAIRPWAKPPSDIAPAGLFVSPSTLELP